MKKMYIHILYKGMTRESPMVLLKDPNSCGLGALTARIVWFPSEGLQNCIGIYKKGAANPGQFLGGPKKPGKNPGMNIFL